MNMDSLDSASFHLMGLRWACGPPPRHAYDASFKPTKRLGVLYVGERSDSNTPVETPQISDCDDLSDAMDTEESKSPPPLIRPDPCNLQLSRDGSRLRVPQNCPDVHLLAFLTEDLTKEQVRCIRAVTLLMGSTACQCPRHALLDHYISPAALTRMVPHATLLLVLANEAAEMHKGQAVAIPSIPCNAGFTSARIGISTLATGIAPRGPSSTLMNLELVNDLLPSLIPVHHPALLRTLCLYSAGAQPHVLASLKVELPALFVKCIATRQVTGILAACTAVREMLDVWESYEWDASPSSTATRMRSVVEDEAVSVEEVKSEHISRVRCLASLAITLQNASSYMLRHCAATTAFLMLASSLESAKRSMKVGRNLECVVLRLSGFAAGPARGLAHFLENWLSQRNPNDKPRPPARLFLQMYPTAAIIDHLCASLCTLALKCTLHVILVGENLAAIDGIVSSLGSRHTVPSKVRLYTALDPDGRTPIAQLHVDALHM